MWLRAIGVARPARREDRGSPLLSLKSPGKWVDSSGMRAVIGKIGPASLPEQRANPMRFDRRGSDRIPGSGQVIAYEVAGAGFGSRHVLDVVDVSGEGMGAEADTALVPGTIIRVQYANAPARTGTVVRCLPNGHGYNVGIAFARAMAA